MKIFSLHAVIVSVIVELVCSLSLTSSQRISYKLSNHNLLHKQRRKCITYLSFLHKNKNYFLEISNVKTYASSKNSSNSPEVERF